MSTVSINNWIKRSQKPSFEERFCMSDLSDFRQLRLQTCLYIPYMSALHTWASVILQCFYKLQIFKFDHFDNASYSNGQLTIFFYIRRRNSQLKCITILFFCKCCIFRLWNNYNLQDLLSPSNHERKLNGY